MQLLVKAAAKSFYVLKPTTWADEVFENKTTPDIKEIENFIKKHKTYQKYQVRKMLLRMAMMYTR
jgi:hypothetical protein